ncbi:MAG: tetratricopeptide repeat protein [Trueperaceae bacterium]
MVRRTLFTLLIALVSWAAAVDAVVHPFRSQDPVVGVAVAERIASSLDGAVVMGPEIAPMLVAPVVVPGGFVNPLVVAPDGAFDRSGVALLAGGTGVPVVVSGVLAIEADGLRLDLVAAVDGALRSTTVRAPMGDLDLLVARAAPRVAWWVGATARATRSLDLAGDDQAPARARALIGAGFTSEALELLEGLTDPHPIDARLRDDLRAAVAGTADGDAALAAMTALSSGDPEVPGRAFARWRAEGGPPVADVWAGAWARGVGDDEAADRAFAAAAEAYPFGRAAQAADRVTSALEADDAEALASVRRDLVGLIDAGEPAALLAAAFAAGALEDDELEDGLLASLGRAAPFLTYPFERRSFLAFARDDALTAAQTLAIAVELEPESDLYWTNLGWSWYLLGFLDRSEAASQRAIELDPGQFIARFNLGLVRVVTDRLEAALGDYREAIRLDPEVDREAIADLVAAEEDYPEAVGVSFALAFLLDRAGLRDEAAEAYERYVERVAAQPDAAGADAARAREAEARIVALRAPLPPIEIQDPPTLSLGRRGPAVETAQPGDPLTVTFEVGTPGDALPRRLELEVELLGADGEPLVADAASVDVPTGAIGYVLDLLEIELPETLPSGGYTLVVVATGDGQEARATREVAVAGAPERLRRLIGRGLVPTTLETGQNLISVRDLGVAPGTVWARWLDELRATAALAEEALPEATSGRFAGMSGGEIFAAVEEQDLLGFVDHLLESGASRSTFALADAFAQWVLDGTP